MMNNENDSIFDKYLVVSSNERPATLSALFVRPSNAEPDLRNSFYIELRALKSFRPNYHRMPALLPELVAPVLSVKIRRGENTGHNDSGRLRHSVIGSDVDMTFNVEELCPLVRKQYPY